MDLPMVENNPESCLAVGLDCRSCVQRSAANFAHICHGLEAPALHRFFVQLYPSQGCAPMARAFELSYKEASARQMPVPLVRATAA